MFTSSRVNIPTVTTAANPATLIGACDSTTIQDASYQKQRNNPKVRGSLSGSVPFQLGLKP
jgi:hypothetical protein